MPTKKFKPTTPSRRHMTVPTFEELTKFTPEKSLVVIKKKFAGRNSYGKITVRHKGGGNKLKYRIIDFTPSISLPTATAIRTTTPRTPVRRQTVHRYATLGSSSCSAIAMRQSTSHTM